MRLPEFKYLRPTSMEEACSLLSSHRERAAIIAGGTALLVYLRQRLLSPEYVIDIKGIPGIDRVDYDGENGLRIGSLTTVDGLNTSALIRERYAVLSQAAGEVGATPLRYRGTVGGNLCLNTRCLYYDQSYFWHKVRPACFKRGGNLCHVVKGGDRCHAVYQGDLAPALMALGAKVKLVRQGCERLIPISEFFTGKGETPNIVEPDEILAEVQVPPQAQQSIGAYQKLRIRNAIDYPLAGVAVVLDMNGGNVCHRARIVLGAVDSAPFEVGKAADTLRGKKVDDSLIEKVAEEAFRMAHPVNNLSIAPGYRRKMVRVLVKRAIRQALLFPKYG